MRRLEARWKTSPRKKGSEDTSNGTGNDMASSMSVESCESQSSLNEERMTSREALERLRLLMKLLDEDLRPIFHQRRGLCDGTTDQVPFENLWLLFDVGELVYQRPKYSHSPPQLLRVTQFTGGRRVLNDNESSTSASLQHRNEDSHAEWVGQRPFYIWAFTLDFDGEVFGPVEEAISILPWQGLRLVADLDILPIRFCRQGVHFDSRYASIDLWKTALVNEGKSIARLGLMAFRKYEGTSLEVEGRQVFQMDLINKSFKINTNICSTTRMS